MSFIASQAPVNFCAVMTTVTGTGQQIFQVSTSGVTAGLTAGNLYLVSPQSNLLNGKVFTVRATGWVKAHGATQTIAPEFQIFPWNTTVAGGPTASGTATFTAAGSATLTAGTVYNFSLEQKFYGDSTAQVINAFQPTVSVGSANISTASSMASQTASYSSASQTEPITGINLSTTWPLASFVVSFANSVADTTETAQLTSFTLDIAG